MRAALPFKCTAQTQHTRLVLTSHWPASLSGDQETLSRRRVPSLKPGAAVKGRSIGVCGQLRSLPPSGNALQLTVVPLLPLRTGLGCSQISHCAIPH